MIAESPNFDDGPWRRGHVVITTDPEMTDTEMVIGYLKTSYWAAHVPQDLIVRSIGTSLVYNLVDELANRQIGFARVVSDRVRFAYLCDVFILSSHRDRGLGTWLIDTVIADPRLCSVGHWVLATMDAQAFYRKLGFEEAAEGRYMVKKR